MGMEDTGRQETGLQAGFERVAADFRNNVAILNDAITARDGVIPEGAQEAYSTLKGKLLDTHVSAY